VNFEEDLRLQFADWLAANGYPCDCDLHAVVMRYQNVTRRIPPQMQWHLSVSDELASKQLPEAIQEGLRLFTEQAERGEDLRPFLSALLRHGDYADLLLSDWGIYHFHLSTKLARRGNRKGLIKGTDELLFAIADPENAMMYLIDIHSHETGFTNQDLLRVLEENWPELLDRHALQRVTPSYENLSDEEVELLRSGGINVAYGTPGGRTVAAMGGGITTAKTNMQDVRTADYLVWRLRRAEEEVRKGFDSIVVYFEREHGLDKDEVSFHAYMGAQGTIWVGETKTGIPVWNEREGWLIAVIEINL
jgi:hypothetical protein